MTTITGTAAGVPFTALAPATDRQAPLIVLWHLLDEPDSDAKMAQTLPLNGVDAWRVYLGLPQTGRRAAGEPDFSDVVSNIFEPIVTQAVAEFPAALAELRSQLAVTDELLLVGGSAGAWVAMEVLASGAEKVTATALISPAVQLTAMVGANERAFGMTYPWSDKTRAVAERLDFTTRAGELSGPILIVTGDDDDEQGFREPAEKLWQRLPAGTASLVGVPGMGHSPTAEVDGIIADWLNRVL